MNNLNEIKANLNTVIQKYSKIHKDAYYLINYTYILS